MNHNAEEDIRIDKWLWAVRIYKTRSLAAEACKKNRVLIDNKPVKPSRIVLIGDIISIKKPPVIYSFEVVKIIEKRVGAPIAKECYIERTPEEELEKLNIKTSFFVTREKGSGRPTKKDRRDIDKITNRLK